MLRETFFAPLTKDIAVQQYFFLEFLFWIFVDFTVTIFASNWPFWCFSSFLSMIFTVKTTKKLMKNWLKSRHFDC